eukprot:840688-Pyramimonas_sp.AAC.1
MMPATQFGAAPRRGADYASHIAQNVITYAEKRGGPSVGWFGFPSAVAPDRGRARRILQRLA